MKHSHTVNKLHLLVDILVITTWSRTLFPIIANQGIVFTGPRGISLSKALGIVIYTGNKILDSFVSTEIPKFHPHEENIPGQSVFPMSVPATAAIESPTPTDNTPL